MESAHVVHKQWLATEEISRKTEKRENKCQFLGVDPVLLQKQPQEMAVFSVNHLN
jgi:hypothetical protein